MIDIKELLKEKVILTDGAMGTYYHEQGGICERAERANLEQPHMIADIHRQYLDAGAQLIRTNTFAANTASLSCEIGYVKEIIEAAYEIALDAVGEKKAAIAADIGPIPGAEDMSEY